MPKAVYPGTFDPVTKGHVDVIRRSARLFENVSVVVARNTEKSALFSLEERVDMLQECVKPWDNVSVSSFAGLTVDCLRQQRAQVIIRGIRAISDFEFEFQMALMNKKLMPECETVYMMPDERFTYLNSGIVKEIAALGGEVSEFVTANVEEALKNRFQS